MINRHAIYHRSKTNYAYAYDEKTVHIRIRTARDNVKTVYLMTDHPDGWEATDGTEWNWKKQYIPMEKEYSTTLFDYWFIAYQPKDYKMRYGFIVENSEEKLAYVERGFFAADDESIKNDINSYFAFPYIHEADIFNVPHWVKETNWYQIFPERFNNGDKMNDEPHTVPWDTMPPRNDVPYGGDIRGIIEKLDYLQELGINGLYLTPIFISPTMHKYDTINYLEIDPSFGTKAEFKELVEVAHQKGIRIMLDAVFNHIGSESLEFQDVIKNGEKSKYFQWFHIEKWPVTTSEGKLLAENYRNFSSNMPKLNTENTEVIEYLLDIATYWIREFDIDAWRLDVANEVDHTFWRKFREVVKTVNPDLYILGETWHDSQAWLNGDQFDGTMNYPLTKPIIEWVATGTIDGIHFQESFVEAILRYSQNVNEGMFNLLDSHDTPRLLTVAGENIERVKICYALLYATIGNPCIFYGSELNVSGGQDPACRVPMPWDRVGNLDTLYSYIQKLIALRSAYPVIGNQGSFRFLDVEKNQLLFERYNETESVYYLINLEDKPITKVMPVCLQQQRVLNLLSDEEILIEEQLIIEANSILILKILENR